MLIKPNINALNRVSAMPVHEKRESVYPFYLLLNAKKSRALQVACTASRVHCIFQNNVEMVELARLQSWQRETEICNKPASKVTPRRRACLRERGRKEDEKEKVS